MNSPICTEVGLTYNYGTTANNGYDRYGNRWIDLGGGSQSLYFTATSNRITGASYDNAGNLLNDGIHTYAFNAENKIRTIDTQSAYVYNGEGQRVRKLLGGNLRLIYGIGGEILAEFDATNGAAVVSRHDYMPFGKELGVGVGGRTVGMGFGVVDGVRQKFTSYERDTESTFDYAGARYYSANQGRFASVDPLMASASTANPQTFNRYAYVSNSPLTLIDPTGMFGICPGGGQIGMGGVPLGTFSLGPTERPQQGAQGPPPPGGPFTPGPVVIDIGEPPPPPVSTVTFSVPEPTEYVNQPLSNGTYFTGVASNLVITPRDAAGNPIPGISVTERVVAADGRIIRQRHDPFRLGPGRYLYRSCWCWLGSPAYHPYNGRTRGRHFESDRTETHESSYDSNPKVLCPRGLYAWYGYCPQAAYKLGREWKREAYNRQGW